MLIPRESGLKQKYLGVAPSPQAVSKDRRSLKYFWIMIRNFTSFGCKSKILRTESKANQTRPCNPTAVPRFKGSSTAVPFQFLGLANSTHHSQTQRLKRNSHDKTSSNAFTTMERYEQIRARKDRKLLSKCCEESRVK